jgi:hypothetical protein
MEVVPWISCRCGKLHTANFINYDTLCKCGARLWEQIPIKAQSKGNKEPTNGIQ